MKREPAEAGERSPAEARVARAGEERAARASAERMRVSTRVGERVDCGMLPATRPEISLMRPRRARKARHASRPIRATSERGRARETLRCVSTLATSRMERPVTMGMRARRPTSARGACARGRAQWCVRRATRAIRWGAATRPRELVRRPRSLTAMLATPAWCARAEAAAARRAHRCARASVSMKRRTSPTAVHAATAV